MAVIAFFGFAAQVVAVGYALNNKDKYLNQVRERVYQEISNAIPGIVEGFMNSPVEDLDISTELETIPNVSSPF